METKNNDPAFLFYSKDFYEGTRTMLPEERACYMDLLIYQHQHGPIPTDIKRVLLYCNGIDEATLIATLEAKFKLCDKGWVNRRLSEVIQQREEFSNRQSVNGKVGQFFKKAKALLTKKEYATLKESMVNKCNDEIYELISGKEIDKAMLIAMLEAMLQAKLKHLGNGNGNIKDNKGGVGEKPQIGFNVDNISPGYISVLSEWLDYKRGRGQTYKTQKSFELLAEQLVQLSRGDPQTANMIVKQSMANNWAGLFELKTTNNGASNGKNIGSKVHEIVTDPATGDFSDDI